MPPNSFNEILYGKKKKQKGTVKKIHQKFKLKLKLPCT